MAKTVTKGLIAKEDVNIGTGTFNRTKSDGTTGVFTQVNAADFPGTYAELIDQSSAPSAPSSGRKRFYSSTSDDIIRVRDDAATQQLIDDTNAQTIVGLKTFSNIPVLPASNPTTSNQATRKAYVDTMAPLAGATFTGAVNVSSGGLSDASRRVTSKHTITTDPDVSVTATTSETDLMSASLAAGLLGTTGGIEVYAWGTVAGSAGTKRVRLYLGATAVTDTTAVSGTADWYIHTLIFNDAVAAGQEVLSVWSDPTNATNHNKDRSSSTENTANSLTVKITGTLGNSADTITQTGMLIKAIL